jgi:hypothetical protein
MPKGKAGADSSILVTHQIDGRNLIELTEDLFGETPVLWGRYFKRFGNTDPVQYQRQRENSPLREKNIRLLPIARQTTRVDGSEADGITDAEGNVEAVIRTFGRDYLRSEGGEFFYFLDVEGPPHSLSRQYWRGWAETVVSHSAAFTDGEVALIPCVYAPQGNDPTWEAIAEEAERGVRCGGAWIARWRRRGCADLLEWDNDIVEPRVDLPCPILLWQYADECHGGNGFDCNETNPNLDLESEVLQKLILPPPPDQAPERFSAAPKSKPARSRARRRQPTASAARTNRDESEDFTAFVQSLNLRHFSASELLIGTDRIRNGVRNSFPPAEFWHNIAPTIIVLDEMRHRLGGAVNLTSTYRNPQYNAQLDGAASRSQHMDFRALDFSTSATSIADLADRARELRGLRFRIPRTGLRFRRENAPFDLDGLEIEETGGATHYTWRGGVGEYQSFVHIDCRGENADW